MHVIPILAYVAIAAAQAAPSSAVNIGQAEILIIQGAFSLIGIALTVSIPIFLPRVFTLLAAHKIMIDQKTQTIIADALHAAIPRALQYAENITASKIDPTKTISVTNPIVAEAANYLIANKADALKALGISPTSTSKTLQSLILAHIAPSAAPTA